MDAAGLLQTWIQASLLGLMLPCDPCSWGCSEYSTASLQVTGSLLLTWARCSYPSSGVNNTPTDKCCTYCYTLKIFSLGSTDWRLSPLFYPVLPWALPQSVADKHVFPWERMWISKMWVMIFTSVFVGMWEGSDPNGWGWFCMLPAECQEGLGLSTR